MKKDNYNNKLEGYVIANFHNTKIDQDYGFAIMLDNDFLMFDSLVFSKDSTDAIVSALKTFYYNLDNVSFITNEPQKLKKYIDEPSNVLSIKQLAMRYDIEPDDYITNWNIYESSFDVIKMISDIYES